MTDDTLLTPLPAFTPRLPPGLYVQRQPEPALPLGQVEQPPRSTAVHSIRPVDTNGRVVDTSVVRALGWSPGDLLSWRVAGGLILITRPGFGRRGITKYGHITLPAAQRRVAGIRVRERVLLAADPDQQLLVVYPAAVLDEILSRRFAEGVPR
ncbi:hypothetical protein [Nocardia cyriacigeorgica]|uniref:hypothetical protein n=1 Tax=Nocardia cyriacigeorgica TaxID=135487 RepID=UPI002457AC90|nr:hypothetical protein [Nocardia cyriacigeorgica]